MTTYLFTQSNHPNKNQYPSLSLNPYEQSHNPNKNWYSHMNIQLVLLHAERDGLRNDRMGRQAQYSAALLWGVHDGLHDLVWMRLRCVKMWSPKTWHHTLHLQIKKSIVIYTWLLRTVKNMSAKMISTDTFTCWLWVECMTEDEFHYLLAEKCPITITETVKEVKYPFGAVWRWNLSSSVSVCRLLHETQNAVGILFCARSNYYAKVFLLLFFGAATK